MCFCAQSWQGGGPAAVAAHNRNRHSPECDPWGTTAFQRGCRLPRSRQQPTIHLVMWSCHYSYVIWIWSTACAASLASCQLLRTASCTHRARRGNITRDVWELNPAINSRFSEGTPGSASDGVMPLRRGSLVPEALPRCSMPLSYRPLGWAGLEPATLASRSIPREHLYTLQLLSIPSTWR